MHKTLPVVFLLVVTLLAGCINLHSAKTYSISGIIVHAGTEIPIANAAVAIHAGSETFPLTSDRQGQFAIVVRIPPKRVKVTVEHPDYLPVQRLITLGGSGEAHVLIELTPKDEGYSIAAGTIDYALPVIPTDGLLASLDVGIEPMEDIWEAEPSEIIVEPYTYSEDAAREIGRAIGAAAYELYPEAEFIVYPKPESVTMDQFLTLARAHPLVKAADINYPVYPLAFTVGTGQLEVVPNDPYYNHQWNLSAVYLPFAWPLVETNATVRIAVLDSLISTAHPDLQQNLNLQDAYNVFEQSTNVSDYYGRTQQPPYSHGTHVIGIIGAAADNGRGIAGAAWGADVQIIPIVVLNQNNRSSLSHVIAAIDKAIELGVDLINMSLGANLSNPHEHMLYAKIQEAHAAGIVMIAAAGNEGKLIYPAGYDEVIAVGATTSDHQITDYSAQDGVRLFAPGGSRTDPGAGILSTDFVQPSGDGYSVARGTSMAAPHVTGIAALIKSTYPYIGKEELEELLWDTGIMLDPQRPDQRLINAYAALANAPISSANIFFSNLDTMTDYEVEFDQNRYFHQLLPPGLYRITAHIDTNHDQMVNPGEWYYESEILLEQDEHVTDLRIRLSVHW